MDVLLKHVEDLIDYSINETYIPVHERIAYMVSHGQSYASNGYSVRTQVIAKALNDNGLETLCFVRPGRPWELGVKKGSIPPEKVVSGVRYIHSRWQNDLSPIEERSHLEACVARFMDLFKIYRPSAVLAASDYIIGLPAWIAAKRLGLPFYNEVRGFWELSKATRKAGYHNSLDFKTEIERNTYVGMQALKVFTLSERMKVELVSRGLDPHKISIIPNGIGEQPKTMGMDSNFRERLGINLNDKVVGYIGSFAPHEGLDTLIDACTKLNELGKRFKLLLVGDYQPLNEAICSQKKIANEPWLIQTGRVPHEEIAKYYSLIDTVVIPRKKLPVCELVSPIKLAEAMSYGKRIVVSDVAPLLEISKKNEEIIVFEAGNSKSLMSCILRSLNTSSINTYKFPTMKEYVRVLIDELRNEYINPPLPKGYLDKATKPINTQSLIKQNNCIEELVTESCDSDVRINQTAYIDNNKVNYSDKQVSQSDIVKYKILNHEINFEPKKYELNSSDKLLLLKEQKFKLKNNCKKNIAEIKINVSGSVLELSAAVFYRLKSNQTTRKAVVLLDFIDKSGSKISNIPGLGVSAAFNQHFRYLNSNNKTSPDEFKDIVKLKIPDSVEKISIDLSSLGLKPDEYIDIRIHGRCYIKKGKEKEKLDLVRHQRLPPAIVSDPFRKRSISDLIVACVLDEFSAECLSHEVKLIALTQEHWQTQLESNPPDFLLIESCWKGNDGNWGTITKGSGGGKKLSGLLRHCNKKGIPTVFWNKEDPPHYDKFGPIAKFFDLVLTTDVNMVPYYKRDYGIDAFPLSFAAQPKIHNPIPYINRLEKAVFAGSYYSDKPKRCEDFNHILEQLEKASIDYDIYDRNYNKNIEKFTFPKKYKKNILGNLIPSEVWKAHKGYKYQVNMNSVQDSETMFARRVYESLASGTPVISNSSIGVEKLFGDVVILSNGRQSIVNQLKDLEESPADYRDLARRGVRMVMREHTYGHRIQKLCELIGIQVEVALPKAILTVKANNEGDVSRAKEVFFSQTAPNKHLFIELDNFDSSYRWLNSSSSSITYAMEFAQKFYKDDKQFYGGEKVLSYNLNEKLPAEALEDFIYWGEI
ncbi:glycosyltransferase [Microbulbifer sp. THAF38]|uniref:glycosyltransferase n=1 Tax=Microbulbifer sp. THAF38 TaxID=2587856 RepID=UPI001269411A|nr:glycosyltransferase [Microbulbifer sp. THAF38]QFT53808.1 putative glycosyl transferase [Microbulbifer sp. THAF38]